MREISLSVANFEAAVCVCVSGMADATGWHKCSADGDTVGTKLCENCAFFVCFFATVINMYFIHISHILQHIPHIFFIIYIFICMYIVYSLLYLMNRDIDLVCSTPQHPVKFAT